MIRDTRQPGPDALLLPEFLDLKAAVPLHRALLDQRGKDVEVDASQVRRLGGLCLQVLLSAVSTWAADGRRLVFLNLSVSFVEGLQRLGLDQAARSPEHAACL